jgi:hypothetical protein
MLAAARVLFWLITGNTIVRCSIIVALHKIALGNLSLAH